MADGMHEAIVTGAACVEMSEDFAEFAKALPAAQKALGSLVKNSRNPHFKKMYAGLDAVVDAVIPPFNDNGFAIMQHPTGDGQNVRVTTMVIHESGQWMRSTLPLRPSKTDPQGVGSAITYGRRYGLMSLAGVAPEDDDGNAASQPRQQAAPPPAPKEPQRMAKEESYKAYEDLQHSLFQTKTREKQIAWFKSNKQKIAALHEDHEALLNQDMKDHVKRLETPAEEEMKL